MGMPSLYEVHWADTDAPPMTEKMRDFLENFQTDSGTYTLDLQQLNEGLEGYDLDPEVQPLVDWLKEYLKDGNAHDFAIG